MKRVLAILLTLVLVGSCLAVISSAEATETENQEIEFEFLEKTPVIDGEIQSGEYGKYPVHTFKAGEDNPGFVTEGCYDITDDDLVFDFYAGWDENNLYMAWKVNTKYDVRIPGDTADGYMYEYCCVQFILTTGAPNKAEKKYQTAEWSGDYLEIGCCLRDDGKSYKVCWSQPLAAAGGLSLSDWEYAGSREGDVTTYEVRLPWNKTGILEVGTDAQFGLTYAVGAQEYFDTKHGLVEYQDAIINGKNADAAAIVTLTGGDVEKHEQDIIVDKREDCPEGKLPEGLEATILVPDKLNAAPGSEGSTLITALNNVPNLGLQYSYCMLLRPEEKSDKLDGYYTLVESVLGNGTAPTFSEEFKDGDIVMAFHSDGGAGADRKNLAMTLAPGQECYLFGFGVKDTGDPGFVYKNCCLIPITDPAAPLFGTWYNDKEVLVFSEDKTGTKGETAFTYEVNDDGVLKIDGKKTEWKIENGVLTLGEETFTKVTAANLDELNGLIALAQAKKAEDYTADSFAAVTEALNAATELVAANPDSRDQEAIDAAAKALDDAIKALVEVKEESTEESKEESKAESAEESKEASETTPEEEGGFPWWAWVIIGVAAAAIVAVVVIVVVKKKKK